MRPLITPPSNYLKEPRIYCATIQHDLQTILRGRELSDQPDLSSLPLLLRRHSFLLLDVPVSGSTLHSPVRFHHASYPPQRDPCYQILVGHNVDGEDITGNEGVGATVRQMWGNTGQNCFQLGLFKLASQNPSIRSLGHTVPYQCGWWK
jgi:hypothetical protein